MGRPSQPLLIVANRLPVRRVRKGRVRGWDISPGGLVAALAPILTRRGGRWIGWSGTAGPAPRPMSLEGIRLQAVPLSTLDVEAYYQGFSNRTIWPLYHDAIREPVFNSAWWHAYVAVNRRFAEAAARTAQRRQMVWVQDYQLQLVPRMLRELRPDLRIGFFLHIPFPPDEIFAWLPWRREILEGLLGADVVGFQTHADAQDFSRAARLLAHAEGTDHELRLRRRKIAVRALPISIDYQALAREADSPRAQRRAAEIRHGLGEARKVLLCVDRLDYTKGIDARLIAFREVLRRGLATVDNCVLMQIAVPSREAVHEYRELRSRVEQLVGRTNGEFSVPGRVPVHFFRRNFSREELVAFYLAADVAVVTPLRDGMNLVAKEYVACRTNQDGVLVLSEFAGAAHELRRALLVNPRDVEGMVRALAQALHLPKREARVRMSALRKTVRRHDVHAWANEFIESMSG